MAGAIRFDIDQTVIVISGRAVDVVPSRGILQLVLNYISYHTILSGTYESFDEDRTAGERKPWIRNPPKGIPSLSDGACGCRGTLL